MIATVIILHFQIKNMRLREVKKFSDELQLVSGRAEIWNLGILVPESVL